MLMIKNNTHSNEA